MENFFKQLILSATMFLVLGACSHGQGRQGTQTETGNPSRPSRAPASGEFGQYGTSDPSTAHAVKDLLTKAKGLTFALLKKVETDTFRAYPTTVDEVSASDYVSRYGTCQIPDGEKTDAPISTMFGGKFKSVPCEVIVGFTLNDGASASVKTNLAASVPMQTIYSWDNDGKLQMTLADISGDVISYKIGGTVSFDGTNLILELKNSYCSPKPCTVDIQTIFVVPK